MEVLDSPEDLVQEDFDVVRGEVLGRDDDLVQIALHQFRDHIDLLEIFYCGRLERRKKIRLATLFIQPQKEWKKV